MTLLQVMVKKILVCFMPHSLEGQKPKIQLRNQNNEIQHQLSTLKA